MRLLRAWRLLHAWRFLHDRKQERQRQQNQGPSNHAVAFATEPIQCKSPRESDQAFKKQEPMTCVLVKVECQADTSQRKDKIEDGRPTIL